MKALLQRVTEARVKIDGVTVGQVGAGLLVFVCAERGDSEVEADKLLAKILKLRIFSDAPGAGPPQARPTPSGGSAVHEVASVGASVSPPGRPKAKCAPSGGSAAHEVASVGASKPSKMNRSVQDLDGYGAHGGLLIVSQFTLAADTSGGNRPSFTAAAAPDEGRRLYDYFVARARALHPVVQTGQFGADMQVHLVNDGPVTIALQITPLPARQ